MIKLTVRNLQGEVIQQGSFENAEQGNVWLKAQAESGAFGKQERWVLEEDLVFLKEDKSKAIACEEVNMGPNHHVMKYQFPPEFTVMAELDELP